MAKRGGFEKGKKEKTTKHREEVGTVVEMEGRLQREVSESMVGAAICNSNEHSER